MSAAPEIYSNSVLAPTPDLHVWEAASTHDRTATERADANLTASDLTADGLTAWVTDRLKAQEAAIAALLSVTGPRTPENSLRLYDIALEQLNLAGAQAGVLNSVAADKAVRDQAQDEAQRVSQAGTQLSLNRDVYLALSAISLEGASPATRHYLERTLLSYRLAGVDKDDATRAHLNQLHEKATRLSLEFSRNIQEGAKTVVVHDAAELDGLPADYLARHTPNCDGHFVITTDQPDMQPVMTFAKSDSLRERMFIAYNTRAYPDNKQILLDLLAVRQEIATLLGFSSWANLATADQMMGSAENVRAFIAKLEEASRNGAQREYEMVFDFARDRQPGLKTMNAASRGYWYEQYRREAFAFDSQSVRPYFPYAQVEQGVLDTASKLFGVVFRRSTAPGWHSDVSVFDVLDIDGETKVGRFFLDMHPRDGKDKWFSATPVVTGVRGRYLPEAGLICNFPRPEVDESGKLIDAGLMQYNDVVTYFHEFGHLMHAILGGQTEWAGLSGFATEGDFIEVPSQMLEEFFRDVPLLQTFARHYETGEILPAETIQKMKLAGAFGRADGMRTQLYYTTLSLDLHDQDSAGIDLDRVTRNLYQSLQPWQWIEGNRMYASFGHLMGYSSNYYTYAFDKVIALDFFAQFDPGNLLGCEAATRYRKTVIEQGGSKPGRQMVQDFLGRDEAFSAFSNWLNEEFEAEPAAV
jgi:thimet oligopeptidase